MSPYLDIPLTSLEQSDGCRQVLIGDGGVGLKSSLLGFSKLTHIYVDRVRHEPVGEGSY